MIRFDSWQGQEIVSSKCPHVLWGPPSLLLTGCWEVGRGEVKFTLEQAMKAQRGSCDIAVLFLWPRHKMGLGGQLHALAALPPWKRASPHCPGSWMGLRASLDRCGKSHPHWHLISGPSSPWRVTIPSTLFNICIHALKL